MVKRNRNLHGSVPDKSKAVLLLIDVINQMNFPGAEKLLPRALRMAHRISRLKKRVRKLGIPTVYVNDNFGKWRSDFRAIIASCMENDIPGREIVKLLEPTDEDYFVLKPKHSAFYETTLDLLLQYLGSENLILTGIQSHICILFSANDAYVREYKLIIPPDCVASETLAQERQALSLMKSVLKADIKNSSRIRLNNLL